MFLWIGVGMMWAASVAIAYEYGKGHVMKESEEAVKHLVETTNQKYTEDLNNRNHEMFVLVQWLKKRDDTKKKNERK